MTELLHHKHLVISKLCIRQTSTEKSELLLRSYSVWTFSIEIFRREIALILRTYVITNGIVDPLLVFEHVGNQRSQNFVRTSWVVGHSSKLFLCVRTLVGTKVWLFVFNDKWVYDTKIIYLFMVDIRGTRLQKVKQLQDGFQYHLLSPYSVGLE